MPQEENNRMNNSSNKGYLFFFIIDIDRYSSYNYTKNTHAGANSVAKQIVPFTAAPGEQVLLQHFNKSAVANHYNGVLYGNFNTQVITFPLEHAASTIQNRQHKK